MYSQFEELNLFVYYSARGLILDLLIWCLGPFVDDSRTYGAFRLYLAHATRALLRKWYLAEKKSS
jgi:hypothetical protein